MTKTQARVDYLNSRTLTSWIRLQASLHFQVVSISTIHLVNYLYLSWKMYFAIPHLTNKRMRNNFDTRKSENINHPKWKERSKDMVYHIAYASNSVFCSLLRTQTHPSKTFKDAVMCHFMYMICMYLYILLTSSGFLTSSSLIFILYFSILSNWDDLRSYFNKINKKSVY